ncbi:hypothetical protein ACQKM1_22570 [Peribacillus frigoritolerans]|uniref:hypothetical protein n=1 Tax=Peribacillus frigoritolerans TaxID=450367 RepID=UPI003D03580E
MSDVVEVVVRSWTSSYDDSERDTLSVNGEQIFSVAPLNECPEDAYIGRDLISSGQIADFLESFLVEHQGKKVKFVYEEGEEEE